MWIKKNIFGKVLNFCGEYFAVLISFPTEVAVNDFLRVLAVLPPSFFYSFTVFFPPLPVVVFKCASVCNFFQGNSGLHLTHVTFSPNGEEILMSYSGEHVYLMDLNQGLSLHSLSLFYFFPVFILSGSVPSTLRIWIYLSYNQRCCQSQASLSFGFSLSGQLLTLYFVRSGSKRINVFFVSVSNTFRNP